MARKPVRVSQLNAYIARLLASDGVLSDLAVTGEVSNFKRHGSGHVYFSLVDEASRIDCFLPSSVFERLGFAVSDGAEVLAEGYINVYEKGGRYSLTIRRLSMSGQGDLAQAFEMLKKKLSEKGYFDEGKKKPLPAFPLSIAIVTSGTGAAVNDMVKIITSRNSVADILIFPTLVQGEGAADMIASRIRQVNADFAGTDVIITGRGGGSSEDLWAFNEEAVADAIFFSKIPVISAVGHETDFTIADFVADRRAETPTAAAALAAPDTLELSEDIEAVFAQMKSSMTALLSRAGMRLRASNMEALIGRLKSGISERGTHAASLLASMQRTVRAKTERRAELDALRGGMRHAVSAGAERAGYRLQAQAEKIDALDPLKVLSRGYAIVEDADGRAVSRASVLKEGQTIGARLSDGRIVAVVEDVVV
ncbi:MAG: exodeoxyribonuclease VII large subunit [Clostridiales bacterium]|nr:exodeoxyribonuclease VII large subunit [Clostridiales bacterium]